MANQPSKYSKFLIGAASAALVASAVAPVASAADFKDTKGNTHEEAINALSDAGVISGYPDGSFLPNKTLTRSDVVKMMGKLLVSLGKEVPTDYKTNPRFTDQTSKTNDELLKYSALVKDNGVFNGLENGSLDAAGDITRENMALVLVRAYDAINKTDLVAHVKEQEFKKDVTDLATAKAEARPYIDVLDFFDITNPVNPTFNPKDTTTRGQFASFLFKTTAVEAPGEKVTTATKVESVTATNLKEVEVKFNGTVDEDSATDKGNYSLKSGKAIKSVTPSADNKSVTITLEGTLANNKAEALTVSNVKAGDITINEKNVEFNVEDNKLPEVSEIKSLGTKSVKVVFTEPVTDLKQNNFTLDGKAYFGKIDMGAGNKSVILTPFTSTTLAVGEHKITVSGVKDFANFTSLNSTHDFTVVEDKVAPTVTESAATLESVTLTFSEDVDASTVLASKVYWKSGDSKKAASSVEALADNKFKFNFSSANSLPTGKVDIHVEGVKDYSANEIAKDTKVTVTPEIDQTRPEVRKVTVADEKTVKVTFSKSIDADSAKEVKNYTVLNKDGKVISVQKANLDPTDSKTVIVTLYTALSTGENTLTIKNLKDSTKLQNTMLDYSEKIVRVDKAAPTFEKIVNKTDRRVVLSFNKKMDVDSLVNYSNYLVKINDQLQALTPEIADISVLQDGTTVVITFAESVNGDKIVFTSGKSTSQANVSELQVLSLKDASGNLLKEFASADGTNKVDLTSSTTLGLANISTDAAFTGLNAELVDTETVKIKFNAGINSASAGAFTALDGASDSIIDSIDVDGTSTVTVKLKKNKVKSDGTGLNLKVDFSKLETVAGNITASADVTITKSHKLLDSVSPEITDSIAYGKSGNAITLTYSEALEVVSGASQDLQDTDFTVVRVSDNKQLNPIGDYNVSIAGTNDNEIKITLTDGSTVDSAYRVTVKDAKYFTDKSIAKNTISDSVGLSELVTNSGSLAQAALISKINAGTATDAEYVSAGFTTVTAGNLSDVKLTVAAARATKTTDLIASEIQTAVNDTVAVLAEVAKYEATTAIAKGVVSGNVTTTVVALKALETATPGITVVPTAANATDGIAPATHLAVLTGAVNYTQYVTGPVVTEKVTVKFTKGEATKNLVVSVAISSQD